jgi:hypothetical protein
VDFQQDFPEDCQDFLWTSRDFQQDFLDFLNFH